MMKKIFFLIPILFLTLQGCAIAQPSGMQYSTKNKKAIKWYEEARVAPNKNIDLQTGKPDFEAGIELLQKALKKDDGFLEAHQLIGEFYRLNGDSKEAVEHYKRSLEIMPSANLNGQLFLDIGELQMKNIEYEDAIRYFDIILNNNDSRIPNHVKNNAVEMRESAVFSMEARRNPVDIDPINIGKGINTKHPEYFPTLTVDGKTMLFTRELPVRNQPRGQEDFFVSELKNDSWQKAVPMPRNINTPRNEGAPTISADGRTLIFVACADETGFNYGPNREGKGSCDLFITKRVGNEWTDPQNLPGEVNTHTWESQPSLSADGKTLYFVRRVKKADRYSREDTDIFVSELQADGTWGKAVPLPSNINTSGRESSVLIHPDGQTLYFTSDGHPGLGGQDIFMSRKDPLGKWQNPINLGYPINTENNENSLLVGPDGEIAYFASDRDGGEGELDIYSFEMPEELRPVKTTYFEGIVYDAMSKKPLEGKFELIDLSTGKVVIESSADPKTGEFMLALPTEREYALNVSYPSYSFFSKNFDMKKGKESVHADVPLVPASEGYSTVLANVFFDLNKSTLRKESYVELNKLIDFLQDNEQIKIEVGGHTDSRGGQALNHELSENRAKAVYDYLIEKGVEKSRLAYKGYGSSQPIKTDEEIAKMSSEEQQEEAHQENRRTEYKIVK